MVGEPAAPVQFHADPAGPAAETNVIPAGSVSVTVIGDGRVGRAGSETSRRVADGSSGHQRAECVLVMRRSALGVTPLTVSVDVRDPPLVGVVVDTVAVLVIVLLT